jgi:hypothetical protein
MDILLAFAPFLAFALLDRIVGPKEGLAAGALVAVALCARDWLSPGRSLKILDVGTLLLFCGLATYAYVTNPTWSVVAVRLMVDSGLLLIVLISLAVGRPFTLQYAREKVSSNLWNTPAFRKTNYVISAVWALAFAVMVAAECALLFIPGLSPRVGVLAIVLALVFAVKFTGWYPERVRSRVS